MSKDNIFNSIELRMPKYNAIEKLKLEGLKKDNRLYGLSSIIIDILFNRGLRSVEDIEKHLYSTIKDCHSPALLKDADVFIKYLIEAIKNNEHIVIYTDYDADGVTSCVIALLSLRNIGVNVDYYTNNRFIEGYGITPAGVVDLQKKYPDVKMIITTDNGIVGFDGIKKATELGIKVLVTDHHEQGDELPKEALAIVNPKRKDCEYPFKGLCGAGVIFKLMLLLYFEIGEDIDYAYSLVDFLAVGTVGDMVPLLDENRIFVKEGIKRIKEEQRPVFTKLREALELSQIDEETFGFQYCPMINALGRIDGSPDDAIELFITDDENKMEQIVKKLVEINDYRKTITKEQEEIALNMVDSMPSIPDVIVLHDDVFHEGVVGLIAGRLKDKYQRPTIVLATHKKNVIDENGDIIEHVVFKGSARSIEGFHIKEVCDLLKDYLLGYGGHAMAGGLSVSPEKFNDFIKAINELAHKMLTKEQLIKKILIDAPLRSSDISIDLIQEIESLKPFGMGFQKPKFGLSQFKLHPVKNNIENVCCGKDKSTLRLVSDNGVTLIMFKYAERYKEINYPQTVKAVGYPVLNIFNGNSYPQFKVENNYIFNPNF